ncbi:phage head closure protein [Tianweitania sediminis]|uniref:Phage head closure protein n=1 Tax=Tianweitania sediminis TaxID=1502156 RepID=A0A8J7R1H2_9HYPH|nr:phage head closure protein [Tianweitania sediminis]MBP0438898.1 phage head closure protein [Tianweitania sediminis]
MRLQFVDPGRFRTQLALEQAVLTDDGAGGHAESWTEIGWIFAALEPVRAQMRFGGDQTLESVTHTVTLRLRDDVASGMRFRRGDRHFRILTVHDPDEGGRYLVCRTEEQGR